MAVSEKLLALRSPHTHAHLRLLFAALCGAAVAALLDGVDVATRGLAGWDVAVLALLISTALMMQRTTLAQLKRKAAQEDESAGVILALMVSAIGASLGGIVAEIYGTRHAGTPVALGISVSLATLVLSWLCMHMLFAMHYAHSYYGDAGDSGSGGLQFPEDCAAPSYWDFVYFSFCIGMTYQVSDVMTKDRRFRVLVTLHGGLSFFYNTFVVALAVSLFSSFGSG